MERIKPDNERVLVESDISLKNAEFLNSLKEMFPAPIDWHVEYAIINYHLCIDTYCRGGSVYAMTEAGPKLIPLFNTPDKSVDAVVKANLSSEISVGSARVLSLLGVGGRNSDTSIMDNILHSYDHMIRSKFDGHEIIVEQSSGEKIPLQLLEF
ncbi:MAG: hypothetical protein JWO54_602 [Candidatus Saccharibacteria bacterium]|nr:hypothetical protein [Candidatus Saccharibacteria bacterium]MDB5180842.1 hypothetical protein [Candidatus Saccharibacteria bacterium]